MWEPEEAVRALSLRACCVAAWNAAIETIMSARDIRALAFWLIGTAAILALAGRMLDRWPFAFALAAAFSAFVLTRPRMIRMLRRLCGQHLKRESYFRN